MTRDELKRMTEARALSGEPFTASAPIRDGEVANGGREKLQDGGDVMRIVDGEIQRLRERGLIDFVREGRKVVWLKVTA